MKEEAEAFKSNDLIKLISLKWQFSKDIYGGFVFTALQLILSNGMKSPLFLAKDITGNEIQTTDLDQSAPV